MVKRSSVSPRDKCKKAFKFPRTLTHLIEISWPIFSLFFQRFETLIFFYREQYFPKAQNEGNCFQVLFVFRCFKDFFFLSHWSSVSIGLYFLCSAAKVTVWFDMSER